MANVGKESLEEFKGKLVTLGLTVGMALEDDSYRSAIVAAIAANLKTSGKC